MNVDMDIAIAKMRPFISSRDWQGLDAYFGELCLETAGSSAYEQISTIDLTTYENDLLKGLQESFTQSSDDIRAIYYEYNMDNNWNGAFYLCRDYKPLSEVDDDWACYVDGMKVIEGPDNLPFSHIYEDFMFDHCWENVVTSFLIARTIAAFGRALSRQDTKHIRVCMAFHEQNPVLRMR